MHTGVRLSSSGINDATIQVQKKGKGQGGSPGTRLFRQDGIDLYKNVRSMEMRRFRIDCTLLLKYIRCEGVKICIDITDRALSRRSQHQPVGSQFFYTNNNKRHISMIVRYVVASVVFIIIDVCFMSTVAARLYKPMITRIQGRVPNYRPIFGILAYMGMLMGLNLFVIPNIKESSRWTDSIIYGGGYGMSTFAMYSFTSMTVFSEWSVQVALAETGWGAFVFAASAVVSSYV